MSFTAKIADLIAEDRTGLLTKHESWQWVRLSEVASILNGAPFDSSMFNTTGGMPLVRIRDVMAGVTSTYYSGEYDATYLLGRGDLLVGMDGDFNTGYWGDQIAVLNQRVCKLTPNSEFYDRALLGYVLPGYLAVINANTPSITVKHLSSKTVGEIDLPLPPRVEQTRIVEKLEELLSDLDAGVAELRASQHKLAQYRQSLLKAAVEGALTADWRAARASSDEPQETGADLLQRILTERRARWETRQLAKFAEQGKTPPKDWKAKYPKPIAPDTTNLPALPDSWTWASLGQLLESLTSGSRDWAPYYDRGTCTFVMAQNVRPWRPDFSFRQLVDPPEGNRDRARSLVETDDLLLTIVGANTGQACRVAEQLEDHFVCQSVALIRLTDSSLSEFVNAVLNSPEHGQKQFREMNYGAGRPHLSFEQIESVLVPLPPASEQQEILHQFDLALMATNDAETQLLNASRCAAAQRKNILKAAFAGQLVPQDPNDEPASVLLERIRAERAQLSAARGVQRTGSNRAPATSSPNQSKRGRKPRTTA
jgi:type I restriction enzyme, S subunit